MTRSRAGFTFIELLVATAIMAVLAGIVIVSFQVATRNARDAKRKADLQEIRGLIENYRLETGAYPASGAGYQSTADGTFLTEMYAADFITRDYADPKEDATHYYRYRLRNLPGCTYELGAITEGDNAAQTCSACGHSYDASHYYCVTD